MLRRIRRELQLVNYYSASRRQTVWTRALDLALILSLLLAIPMALLCESVIKTETPVREIHGGMVGPAGGPFVMTIQRNADTDLPWPSGPSYADFTLRIVDVRSGWPVTSRIERRPPRLDFNLFDRPGGERETQFAADDPVRIAIERALNTPEYRDALLLWREQATDGAQRLWLGSIYAVGIWWVMLFLFSFVMIGSLRLLGALIGAHRSTIISQRLAKGHCPYCDYDLHGLEFNDRCPECGSIV